MSFFSQGALIERFTEITASGGNTLLDADSTSFQVISGSNEHAFTLPDATTLTLGRLFYILNKTTKTIKVYDKSGALIGGGDGGLISPGQKYEFALLDNSVLAGTWDAQFNGENIGVFTAGEIIPAYTAVYVSAGAGPDGARTAGEVYATDANYYYRKDLVGITLHGVNIGDRVLVQQMGTLPGLTGLTNGATYFLDPTTPGAITDVEPSAAGNWKVVVGFAVSTTELNIPSYRIIEEIGYISGSVSRWASSVLVIDTDATPSPTTLDGVKATVRLHGSSTYQINLTDAALPPIGRIFTIENRATESISVYGNSGTQFLSWVGPNETKYFQLIQNIDQDNLWDVSEGHRLTYVQATAGMTITKGKALYISPGAADAGRTAGSVYYADASSDVRSGNYIGFAMQDATAGQSLLIQIHGALNSILTGLTAGATYYLSDATAGDIVTTAGLYPIEVGKAVTSSSLVVMKFDRVLSHLTATGLTTNRLLYVDGSSQIQSVLDLTSFWIVGTANEVEVLDDGDGTATIGLPNDVEIDTSLHIIGTGTSAAFRFVTGGARFNRTLDIYSPGTGSTPLVIHGIVGQTASYLDVQDSTTASIYALGVNSATFNKALTIDGSVAADIQLLVSGAASQSTYIFAVEDSSGNDYLRVQSGGTTEARTILPLATNTYDLGSSSVYWNRGYITSGYITTVYPGVAAGTGFGNHLYPTATDTYDVGSGSYKWRYMYMNRLYADYSSHLYPITDSTYNIGATANRWLNGYFDNINVTALTSGHIVPITDSTYDLGTSANRWRYGYFDNISSGSIYPISDSAYSLGTTSNRWLNGYFDNLYTTTLYAGESSHLYPIAHDTYDIGTNATRWRYGYFTYIEAGNIHSNNTAASQVVTTNSLNNLSSEAIQSAFNKAYAGSGSANTTARSDHSHSGLASYGAGGVGVTNYPGTNWTVNDGWQQWCVVGNYVIVTGWVDLTQNSGASIRNLALNLPHGSMSANSAYCAGTGSASWDASNGYSILITKQRAASPWGTIPGLMANTAACQWAPHIGNVRVVFSFTYGYYSGS